jgi:hypothetical protein
MIYIYLKTHNQTGLKYLGKTEKDPYIYKGSGIYWKAHLRKYGNDVSTEILFKSEHITEIREVGLKLSKEFNIVESNDFANLIEENGIGGVTSTSFKKGCKSNNKGKKIPLIAQRRKEYWDRWRQNNPDYKSKWKKYVPKGRENWIRADNTTKLNSVKLVCPHCGIECNVGNANRWHFDKCKYKNNV